jgi:uncharacterized protein YlzI (FlbEa/FlbD family)
MIKLTQHDGRAIHLAPAAIAQVTEADPREWHGIKALIVTFQGKTLEVQETADQVVAAMAGASA